MDRLREKIFSSFSSFHRFLLTFALGLHRFFPSGVAAAWLHQKAMQGQSQLAFHRGQPAPDRSRFLPFLLDGRDQSWLQE